MVAPSYMLERPKPPGAVKRGLDQRVLPIAIDAAASVEAVAERIAAGVRAAPFLGIGLALVAGIVLGRAHRR